MPIYKVAHDWASQEWIIDIAQFLQLWLLNDVFEEYYEDFCMYYAVTQTESACLWDRLIFYVGTIWLKEVD